VLQYEKPRKMESNSLCLTDPNLRLMSMINTTGSPIPHPLTIRNRFLRPLIPIRLIKELTLILKTKLNNVRSNNIVRAIRRFSLATNTSPSCGPYIGPRSSIQVLCSGVIVFGSCDVCGSAIGFPRFGDEC
jgi:hypothetical protein